jgi:hypothetical protein
VQPVTVADRPLQEPVPPPGTPAEIAACPQVAQVLDGDILGGLFLSDEPVGLGELLVGGRRVVPGAVEPAKRWSTVILFCPSMDGR